MVWRRFMVAMGASALSFVAMAPSSEARPLGHAGFPPIQDVMQGVEGLPPHINDARADGDGALGEYQHLLDLIPESRNKGAGWEIYDTEWSEAHERGYEAFVQAIGRSGCISIDDCLRSRANPYRDLEDDAIWLGDCTDMVYVLRGYYAWKNGLPFSFQDAVSIRPGKDAGNDSRYSKYGNRVVSRFDVTQAPGSAPRDGGRFLRGLYNIVSTAMLRTNGADERPLFSDFCPVSIDRDAIRPGAVAYDVHGHVSLVYDITDNGRVLLISSHPDYTVTRDTYGANFLRTGPELGGGLKAWRPIKLVGANKTRKGTYVGGRIIGTKNAALPHFSMEQYFGTHPDETGEWQKGRFVTDGRTLPYYQFVKAQLRDPALPFDPVDEFANSVDSLCESFRHRRTAVNLAIFADIPSRPAPQKLPDNIYGTYGDWERYATPSRDARLKTDAVELRRLAERLLRRVEDGDSRLAYSSPDLAAALLDVYDRGAASCKLSYKRSDGAMVRLTMHDAMARLFDMSFDPFHCPERRWGAQGYELQTCTDDPKKTKWYEAQRYLRYQFERTYDLRTDFAAEDLKSPEDAAPEEGGIGRASAPDVDVKSFLTSRSGPHANANSQLASDVIKASDAVNAPATTGRNRR